MFDLFNVTNLISSFVLQLELATKLIKAVINFCTKQTGEKIQIFLFRPSTPDIISEQQKNVE
jgi:hypothetical protein